MKKTAAALFLTAVLILTLCACGSSPSPTAAPAPDRTAAGPTAEESLLPTEPTAPEKTAEPETPEETTAEPETPEMTAADTTEAEETTAPEEPSPAYSDHSGFYSMNGTVARLGSDTYFVAYGLHNDCTWNGDAYSASIYRIGDEENAVPEAVYTVPAAVVSGTEQETMMLLTAVGDKLWFLEIMDRDSEELVLKWIDPNADAAGGSVTLPFPIYEVSDAFGTAGLFFDGEAYYFLTGSEDRLLWRLDAVSGVCTQIDVSPLAGSGQSVYIFTVSHGYLYYCLADAENGEWDNKIYRASLNTMTPEEICAIDVEAELEDANFFYASESYLYYKNDDTLYGIRIADGERLTVLSEEDGFTPDDSPTWCITEEEIRYASPDGIYCCGPEGEDPHMTAQDPAGEDKAGLVVSGDWIWLSLNDHPEYTRLRKTEGIVPDRALVSESRKEAVREEIIDGWECQVYPEFVRITGYQGDETAVKLPGELAGLPVRSIGSWQKDSFGGTETLILPESLKAVSYLYAENVSRIELPASIETFTHRGFTYSFRTDSLLTVAYPGTLKEFEAVCRHSSALYSDMGIDADCGSTEFILECADGLFTCEPSGDGREVFVPYEAPSGPDLNAWLGIWECEGETLEITAVDEDGIELIYHTFTAAGRPIDSPYVMAFENEEKTAAGEDPSVEQTSGWRYLLLLDPDARTITMKSRYPDRTFTPVP